MPKYPQHDIVRRLFQKGQPINYGKADVILGNDVEPNGIYYIDTGYVKVYSISNEGDQYLHIIYGSGEIFPIVWAYLGGSHQSVFYEAISDCLLWRLHRDWFNEFVSKRVDVGYAMSLQLANQFKVFSDRVDNLEHKKASDRVAYRLLFLASRFGIRHGLSIVIDPPITHEIVANSINLARESVSREIEKLEQQQILRRLDHRIIIYDIDALAAMVSPPLEHVWWEYN